MKWAVGNQNLKNEWCSWSSDTLSESYVGTSKIGSHDPFLRFKDVSDANQHFYELKQWQNNNWVQK